MWGDDSCEFDMGGGACVWFEVSLAQRQNINVWLHCTAQSSVPSSAMYAPALCNSFRQEKLLLAMLDVKVLS